MGCKLSILTSILEDLARGLQVIYFLLKILVKSGKICYLISQPVDGFNQVRLGLQILLMGIIEINWSFP